MDSSPHTGQKSSTLKPGIPVLLYERESSLVSFCPLHFQSPTVFLAKFYMLGQINRIQLSAAKFENNSTLWPEHISFIH
jgi:hypothetical protein